MTVSAQGGPGGGDPARMRKMMSERAKPQLVEKAKITEAEANKVLDIYFAAMPQRRELRVDNTLSDDDKKKKLAAIEEESTKKYRAIPLTDEQVKAVNEYFEDMRKNMQNRRPDVGR
jgi:site-specific recombinase XerD